MNLEIINNVLLELKDDFPRLEFVSNLKSGKEADVFLIDSDNGLLALKIFRQNIKFSTRIEYMELNAMKSRSRKAVMQRSKAGRRITESLWTQTEFDAMKMLYEYGANVPKPYANTNNAILMEYLGDCDICAPRLIDVQLTKDKAFYVFEQVYRNIELFLECGFVHSDLSPYNILYWNKAIFIIDFPQIIKKRNNSNAYRKCKSDIDNMVNYFNQYLEQRMTSSLYSLLNKI